MPQVFQVLKCYKCLVFQIHQTKKSNKFECKMCGEKQSIKRHYGIGTGKDCRLHVQRLNSLRGETEETSTQGNSDDEFEDDKSDEETTQNVKNISTNAMKRSRWSAFVDKEEVTEDTDEPMFLGDKEVMLEIPQKKKTKKFKVKTNSSNNLEDLNSLMNTSYSKLESYCKVNNIINIETENSLKSVQDFTENNDDEILAYNEHDNIKKQYNNPTICKKQKSPHKLDVLHPINTNSKWAQFVDIEDEVADENEDLNKDMSNIENNSFLTKTDNFFSLCDDSDLDNMLDF
ncbi:uncharacterized protein [Epargyreus clarus]|uniref:uncharacterized protein n=1 Tax=Epargyreus clarus TaxID=520877 RepID=UPI003C2C4C31